MEYINDLLDQCNIEGITSTNIDYATWGFLISTAALTVITYYYAKQTRNLSRNQFRPYCYALLHPTANQGLSLFIRNNGVMMGVIVIGFLALLMRTSILIRDPFSVPN